MAVTALAARGWTPSARTTPGRLRVFIGVLLVLSLAWGGVGAWAVAAHSGAAHAVAYTNEPLSLRAQQLYADLADADVTITTAYLQVGPGNAAPSTRGPRQRFDADLADASRQLAVLSASSPSPGVTLAVATIVGELPVYGHDVAIAETEYNQGVYPAGGSFIEVASIDAHLTLLPAARVVYQAENATVQSAEGRATSAPLVIIAVVLAVVLAVVTAAVLAGVAIWLARRTNRYLNVGLVVAGVALLVSGIWLGNAFAAASSDLSTAISQGAVTAEAAAQASIDVEAGGIIAALHLPSPGTGMRPELTTQTAVTVVASQQFVGLTGPFRYIFIAWMVMVVGGQWWLPRGPFRAAAQRGGWRLAIAVLSSLSMLAFGIGIAVGQLAIAIAALIICAPPTWFLYIRFFRDAPQPERRNETSD